MNLMRDRGISQLPVTKDQKLVGLLTEQNLLDGISSTQDLKTMPLSLSHGTRSIPCVQGETPLATLEDMVSQHHRVLVVDQDHRCLDIITKIDLVLWLSKAK
jgi:predicted transcriptional regulator